MPAESSQKQIELAKKNAVTMMNMMKNSRALVNAPAQKKLGEWIERMGGVKYVVDYLFPIYTVEDIWLIGDLACIPKTPKTTFNRMNALVIDKIRAVHEAALKPVPETGPCHWCGGTDSTVQCQLCPAPNRMWLHHFCMIENVPILAEGRQGLRACRGCSAKALDQHMKQCDRGVLQIYCKMLDKAETGPNKELMKRIRASSNFDRTDREVSVVNLSHSSISTLITCAHLCS